VVGAPRLRGALTTQPPAGSDPRFSLASTTNAARARAAGGLFEEVLRRDARSFDREPELPVPVPGSRTLGVPLRIGIALDVSGSTSTTDPSRVSHAAALLVCDWLATNSENSQDEIGVVRFADRADAVGPIRCERAPSALARSLKRGKDVGGGTQLAPAVEELLRLLGGNRPGRRVALIVTDGQVAESDDLLRGIFRTLGYAADAIYVLGLDHDGSWSSETRLRYQGLGLSGEVAIGRFSRGHLAHAIASVLMHEAGLRPRAETGRP
jgi:hypothetical protein